MNTKWKVTYLSASRANQDANEQRFLYVYASSVDEAMRLCRDCVRKSTPICATNTYEVPMSKAPPRDSLAALIAEELAEQSELDL